MKKITLCFLFLFFCSCSQEYVTCESGFGYLHKDGNEFVCPFTLQRKIATTDSSGAYTGETEFIDYNGSVTILDSNADDYFPLRLWNVPYMYRVKMHGLKKDFTEEQYTVHLWTADENFRTCGESKEFTFYKIAESTESVEYVSRTVGSSVLGQYLYFGQREMPSYKWYHVLKVCDEKKGFHLIGEIVK